MKKIIFAAGALVVLAPLVSFAAYQNIGKSVVVNASQPINDNAYVAGGTVAVSSVINGDLLAAGGSVTISGNVAGDIMAAGGNVTLSGVSAEDARIAGGNLSVGAVLSGELMAAGGQISVTPGSVITKDSAVGGGSVTFNGDEMGNLDVRGGSVFIGGTIEKNLTITGAKSITIGQSAVIKGNLDYTGPTEAAIASGAQILGSTTFHKAAAAMSLPGPFAVILTFWWIAKFLMVLLAAYLLWYLFRSDMVALLTEAGSRFWKELLRGFIVAVAVPAAIIVACVTVIGIFVGGIAALCYAVLLMLGFPVTVLVVASLLKKRATDLRWFHILLAAALIEVVSFIPFIGWLAYGIVYLASFGALTGQIHRRFSK